MANEVFGDLFSDIGDTLIQYDDDYIQPVGEWGEKTLVNVSKGMGAAAGVNLGGAAGPGGAVVGGTLGAEAGEAAGHNAVNGIHGLMEDFVGWFGK